MNNRLFLNSTLQILEAFHCRYYARLDSHKFLQDSRTIQWLLHSNNCLYMQKKYLGIETTLPQFSIVVRRSLSIIIRKGYNEESWKHQIIFTKSLSTMVKNITHSPPFSRTLNTEVFLDIDKIPLRPSLLQAEWSQLSQPPLVCQILQDLSIHLGLSLDLPQHTRVFLALGSPELDTAFQIWSHQGCIFLM